MSNCSKSLIGDILEKGCETMASWSAASRESERELVDWWLGLTAGLSDQGEFIRRASQLSEAASASVRGGVMDSLGLLTAQQRFIAECSRTGAELLGCSSVSRLQTAMAEFATSSQSAARAMITTMAREGGRTAALWLDFWMSGQPEVTADPAQPELS